MPTMWSTVAAVATLSTFSDVVSALVLQDLPHNDGLKYTKRGDPLGCLDLKSEESFLWGAADETQAALGNLTVYMPDAAENILSMERFNDMLTSVNCTETSIDMTFRDDDTFAYAKVVWDWVNGEENDTFVMVAGAGACGWNTEHRQPFQVTTLAFDEDANVAHLAAQALDWAQAIHTYKLEVGGTPVDHLQKRFGEINYNKDLNIDFNHQFPVQTVSLPMPNGVTATLDMSNCSTSGNFAFQFSLETILLIPKSAKMTVHPQDVALTIAPSLTLTGNLSEPRTADLELARINLAGIQIPAGILDIGPDVVLSVGATVGPLQGEASVEAGVVYSLENSAIASVDIMGFEVEQSGWTPQVATTPPIIQAELDGKVKAYVKAELELAAKAFGIGFDMGIGLVPYLAADLATVTAESGNCGSSDGLAIDPNYGLDLILDAHTPFNGEDDPLFEITLFSLDLPLEGTCLPFDSADIVPAQVLSADPLSISSASAVTAISSTSVDATPAIASATSSAPPSSVTNEPYSTGSAVSSPVHIPSFSSLQIIDPVASTSATVYGYAIVSALSTVISTSSSSVSSVLVTPTVASAPQYGRYGGYGGGKYGYSG